MDNRMSRYVTLLIKCASCGKQKGDNNHWFLLSAHQSIQGYYYDVHGLPIIKSPKDLEDDQYPACGEECLQKLESRIRAGEKI
jgi:hypothetical protein